MLLGLIKDGLNVQQTFNDSVTKKNQRFFNEAKRRMLVSKVDFLPHEEKSLHLLG